jgi:alginate O-acetyltransferase complex protein AlgJ
MPKYTVRTHDLEGQQTDIQYAIDFPRVETLELADDFLTFRAWAFATSPGPLSFVFSFDDQTQYSPNTERPDVKAFYNLDSDLCGIHIVAPLLESFQFGVAIGERVIWLAQVEFTKLQVLEGSQQYLFLDNDDNQSVDQYSGKLKIDPENMGAWGEYFDDINLWLHSNPAKFAFCLAPAKEFIFPELYPIQRLGITPTDQFVSEFGGKAAVINPIELLSGQKNLTYTQSDTHWTDFGAQIVAASICSELQIGFQPTNFDYKIKHFTGDLGIKFNPQRSEYGLFADTTSLASLTYDNCIPVRGNVICISNPLAALNETCLIFGSSSAESVAKQLSSTFRRVVRVFSGAEIDYNIVAQEQPTCIVILFSSRFLIRAPSPNFSIGSEILRKVECMSAHEITQLKHGLLTSTATPADHYYVALLENLLAMTHP